MPRNRGGRPKGSTKENNMTVSKTIRLPADEWVDVEDAADSRDEKTSQFIRWCIGVGLARWRRSLKKEPPCEP